MKPVDQTRFAVGDDVPPDQRGNCMQAAVASLLELDLDDVPNFIEYDDPPDHDPDAPPAWWTAIADFTVSLGYAIVTTTVPLPCLGLMSGQSPRGDWKHLVVARGWDLVHDPHPDRTGVTDPDSWWYLVPTDLAPQRSDRERRVLDAVANWRTKPDSSGALFRLMSESAEWLAASR